jgi:8-oxo-dGTP pyrophosphatase MutT (NUDIX family)
MPPVSEEQRKAMWAAAKGQSTLGIPQKVGKEFVGADAIEGAKGHAAGILFVAPSGKVLLLRRSDDEPNFAGHWALPGGKVDDGETPELGADREVREEIGAQDGRKKLLDRRVTPNGMVFHTFAQAAPSEFVPRLNHEHTGYAWAPLRMLPGPMHPAVQRTLDDRLNVFGGEHVAPEEWETFNNGFQKWLSEPEPEGEPEGGEADAGGGAEDHALAFDRRPVGMAGEPVRAGVVLALDRESVRSKDVDGRLHVETSHISKSCISPYLGKEIPNWEALGLNPNRVYQLFRDPEELQKAAPTFNNLPLLSEHVPVSADAHRSDLVIGSTGSNASFAHPYLDNGLVIWPSDAISDIETGTKRELSSAYRYRADMTPGTYKGDAYDGVMRDIVGNHVALVKEGRAGSDVVVGDSRETLMSKPVILTRKAAMTLGAIIAHVKPLIAADAKPNFSRPRTSSRSARR